MNISIFYSVPHSGQLLKELSTIMKDLRKEEWVQTFWISLNFKRGHNTCLHFTPGNKVEPVVIATHIRQKISCFLTAVPSVTEPPQYPLKGFLMDFPANSIQYNIVRDEPDTEEEYKQQLSLFMMEMLSADVIDDESVFSFALYCAMAMAAAVPEAFNVVAPRFKAMPGNESELARQIYTANKTELRAALAEDWLCSWTDYLSLITIEENQLYLFFHFLQYQLSLSADALSDIIHIARLMRQ